LIFPKNKIRVTGRPSGKDNTVRGRRELIDREIKHYEDNG
jgi:hypothetical protein